MTGKIELTAEEQMLADQIEFDIRALSAPRADGHEIYQNNAALIPQFLQMISDRRAIPKVRIDYFVEPEFNLSRMKGSNKQLFERNGCKGIEIYKHPHFLPYLRFMVFGADLPKSVTEELSAAIGEPQYFSSGDLDGVRKVVRKLAREYGQDMMPEEVFKFAVDLGLPVWMARSLRDAAVRAM